MALKETKLDNQRQSISTEKKNSIKNIAKSNLLLFFNMLTAT